MSSDTSKAHILEIEVKSKSFENDALSVGTSFKVDCSENPPLAIVITPSQDEIK